MQFRPVLLLAGLLIAGTTANAQEVRVEVVELSNGKPIVGANVSILTDSMTSLGGGFSDPTGHTVLRAPVRGKFRVRADKVGYDTWTSVVLHLGAKPVIVRVGMSPTRAPSPVVGRSETACQQLNSGTPAANLWIEIRKALAASALTEAQGLVPLDVELYERVLDRNGSVVSEKTEQRTRLARRPITGISVEQLDTTRRGESFGESVYRAPEVSSLVSDQFIKTHCFAAIRGYGAENGLTGLEFRPMRTGGAPDLAGVLWLDPARNSLKTLAFDWVNLPIPLRVARTMGRLEFQQLPNGHWIVPRWYIRMPRVAQTTPSGLTAPAGVRDSLVGYQEAGGTAQPAGSTRPAVAAASERPEAESPNQGMITGVVLDSTTGLALRGVQVSLGQYKTATSQGGRYELAVNGAVSDKLIFDHPRLRLFRVAGRVQNVSVAPGSRAYASVIVPSFATIRRQLCGQNETGTESQGMVVGYVRDGAGNPISNAHVWATWRLLWIEQNGRLVSTNQQRTAETDTGPDGSYVLCGFTRNAQITARASMAGRGTAELKITLPPNMVQEYDFQLGAR